MEPSNDRVYKIAELADAANVTPRTIRYYTGEGLLPPPDARGAYALYGEDHLNRLRLIARLKESYLPLGEIKALLGSLAPEQVIALLAEYEQQTRAPSSALDYVTQILTRKNPGQLAEGGVAYGASAPAPAPTNMPRARLGLAESAAAVAPAQAPAALPVGRTEPAAPAPPAGEQAERGGLLERLLPRRRGGEEPRQAVAEEERWRRVTLAPGVELHLREPLASGLRERVEELIVRARELLSPER